MLVQPVLFLIVPIGQGTTSGVPEYIKRNDRQKSTIYISPLAQWPLAGHSRIHPYMDSNRQCLFHRFHFSLYLLDKVPPLDAGVPVYN